MPPPASTTLLSTGRSIPTLAFCEVKFASVGVNGAKGAEVRSGIGLKGCQDHEEDRRGHEQGDGPGQPRQNQLLGKRHDRPIASRLPRSGN